MLLVLVSSAWAARPADVGFVDSAEGHVRCHYQRAADEPRCEQVVVWAEEAWSAQVDGLGFRPAPPDAGDGGSDALDVYVTRAAGGADQAWVDCEDGEPDCQDDDPDDAYASTPSYVAIDPRTADALFRHYVHHEFNHTCQYATDFAEPFLTAWEGTAVAAEHWTDPSWTTSPDDFADWQAAPWASAVLQDGYFLDDDYGFTDSWYEYGAVGWVFFLDDAYGDGHGAIGPALWDAMAQPGRGLEPDVLDAWGELSGAGDWREPFERLVVARARIGTDASPAWAAFVGEEGYAWRESTGALPLDATPTLPPFPLGTSYFDVDVHEGDDVEITVDGDPGADWAVAAVEADSDDVVEGTSLVHHVTSDGTLTIAVANLGPPGMDADDPLETASFRVRADVVTPPLEHWGRCGDCNSAGEGLPSALVGVAVVLGARRRRGVAPSAV